MNNQLALAEKEAFEAEAGSEVVMDLMKPLGMIVNPDCKVSQLNPGGQAERLGVPLGCQIVGAGDSPVNTLAELKAMIAQCKTKLKEKLEVKQKAAAAISVDGTQDGKGDGKEDGENDMEENDNFIIEYIDLKRIARAHAKVAKLRSEQSKKHAKSLATEFSQAKKHAKLEAERAEAILKKNEELRVIANKKREEEEREFAAKRKIALEQSKEMKQKRKNEMKAIRQAKLKMLKEREEAFDNIKEKVTGDLWSKLSEEEKMLKTIELKERDLKVLEQKGFFQCELFANQEIDFMLDEQCTIVSMDEAKVGQGYKAGLEIGCKLLTCNNKKVQSFDQLLSLLKLYEEKITRRIEKNRKNKLREDQAESNSDDFDSSSDEDAAMSHYHSKQSQNVIEEKKRMKEAKKLEARNKVYKCRTKYEHPQKIEMYRLEIERLKNEYKLHVENRIRKEKEEKEMNDRIAREQAVVAAKLEEYRQARDIALDDLDNFVSSVICEFLDVDYFTNEAGTIYEDEQINELHFKALSDSIFEETIIKEEILDIVKLEVENERCSAAVSSSITAQLFDEVFTEFFRQASVSTYEYEKSKFLVCNEVITDIEQEILYEFLLSESKHEIENEDRELKQSIHIINQQVNSGWLLDIIKEDIVLVEIERERCLISSARLVVEDLLSEVIMSEQLPQVARDERNSFYDNEAIDIFNELLQEIEIPILEEVSEKALSLVSVEIPRLQRSIFGNILSEKKAIKASRQDLIYFSELKEKARQTSNEQLVKERVNKEHREKLKQDQIRLKSQILMKVSQERLKREELDKLERQAKLDELERQRVKEEMTPNYMKPKKSDKKHVHHKNTFDGCENIGKRREGGGASSEFDIDELFLPPIPSSPSTRKQHTIEITSSVNVASNSELFNHHIDKTTAAKVNHFEKRYEVNSFISSEKNVNTQLLSTKSPNNKNPSSPHQKGKKDTIKQTCLVDMGRSFNGRPNTAVDKEDVNNKDNGNKLLALKKLVKECQEKVIFTELDFFDHQDEEKQMLIKSKQIQDKINQIKRLITTQEELLGKELFNSENIDDTFFNHGVGDGKNGVVYIGGAEDGDIENNDVSFSGGKLGYKFDKIEKSEHFSHLMSFRLKLSSLLKVNVEHQLKLVSLQNILYDKKVLYESCRKEYTASQEKLSRYEQRLELLEGEERRKQLMLKDQNNSLIKHYKEQLKSMNRSKRMHEKDKEREQRQIQLREKKTSSTATNKRSKSKNSSKKKNNGEDSDVSVSILSPEQPTEKLVLSKTERALMAVEEMEMLEKKRKVRSTPIPTKILNSPFAKHPSLL